ncbi:MAG: hypothetical protein DRQ51_10475 [Gammaproteobacteria bacterium]|nr:MAG: hypothetical protein DRQ51_10475 [Gammaproteobacteria bacterium]
MQKLIIILFFISTITACTNSTPDCGDEASIKVLSQIINEQYQKSMKTKELNLYEYSIENIRLVAIDKDTKSKTCAANIITTRPGKTKTVPIEYRMELTSDGGFYMSAQGLYLKSGRYKIFALRVF